MKQIKNPEYTKWCRNLRNFAMANKYYWEEIVDDCHVRLHPFSVTQMLHIQEQEEVREWLTLNPIPAKTIDDPDFVALQEQINVLEKENSGLKQGIGLDMSKLLHAWHEHNDALSIDDIQFVVDKLLTHMYINDTINSWWILAEEDKHFYTDKGLEAPSSFRGINADYEMTNVSVYISAFKASRYMSREERYYKALNEDIERKLNKKETK